MNSLIRLSIRLVWIIVLSFFASCSLTSHLPEGEILYTGIHSCKVTDDPKEKEAQAAIDAVKAALAASPNGAILGSSSIRNPYPPKLWVYNRWGQSKRRFGKWLFKHFSTKPVLISGVNPDTRVKVADNILKEYGYFRGNVTYSLRKNKRNERKASIDYSISLNEPFLFDSIEYLPISTIADSLLDKSSDSRLLQKEKPFTYKALEGERNRIAEVLQNRGFYYLQSSMLEYKADTLLVPTRAQVRLGLRSDLPEEVKSPFTLGNIDFYFKDDKGVYSDTLYHNGHTFYYNHSLPVRPSVLERQLRMKEGHLYTLRGKEYTFQKLNALGIFRMTEIDYKRRPEKDILDVDILLTLDDPINSELEFNFTTKSNNQIGPAALFSVTKRNIFRGGETFSFDLKGSYEWQTGKRVEGNSATINSYELGTSLSLAIPRILFPHRNKRQFIYPAVTSVRLSAEQLNRARFFKMLSFSEDMTYKFQTSRVNQHLFSPFSLSYNYLQKTTNSFDSIMSENRALALSFQNQFLLSMGYTYTYDNTSLPINHKYSWELSLVSAGTLLASVYTLAGVPFTKQKELFNLPFAQFVRLSSEFHYNYKIDRNQSLATRLSVGMIYAYGEGGVAPYSEQFFVGGANSIRAFTIRSIGPGGYVPSVNNRYSYLDQTGDIKLEGNVEYRFRLLGNLHGACFIDAGNCWLLKEDPKRPKAHITLKDLPKQIALGTGIGLRYDLSFLVVRLDMGIALHVPYETTRKGYYNIPRFKDGLGFHLAIGYPF